MKRIQELIRANILDLKSLPKTPPQKDFKGKVIDLSKNENPFNSPYNKYQDTIQSQLRNELASIKYVSTSSMLVTNGVDEAIGMIYNLFCEPREDNVVAITPTYLMYEHYAHIHNVTYKKVALEPNFQLNAAKVLDQCDQNTKVIWLCSPNNPTGNNLSQQEIEKILSSFDGIIVIDESYSDFSEMRPFRYKIKEYPNLVVLNSLDNSWASASVPIGMLIANEEIITYFEKIELPHHINVLTHRYITELIQSKEKVEKWVTSLIQERIQLMKAVYELPICNKVYPSATNFFLAEMTDAGKICDYLHQIGINTCHTACYGLEDCIRFTVGNKSENSALLSLLRRYSI